jgi:hypothetical protein
MSVAGRAGSSPVIRCHGRATCDGKQRRGIVSRFLTLPGGETRIELMTGPWIGDPASTRGHTIRFPCIRQSHRTF